MEKRDLDLRKLTKQAFRLLESKESPEKYYPKLIIQISHLPSFDNNISWSIFSDQTASNFILKRTEWNKIFDFQRFHDPMIGLKHGWNLNPSISHRILALLPGKVALALTEIRNINIVPLKSQPVILDGTRRTVFIDGLFENRVISWNSEPPEWKALVEWTSRLIQIFDQVSNGEN